MEVLHEAPVLTSFTPLSEHQSQTPESFYSGPPVLYNHSPQARILILQSELYASPALSKLGDNAQSGDPVSNGHTEEEDREVSIEGVDIWVTSENFTLFRPSKSTGITIPYPTISLHAIQPLPTTPPTQGLYLQLTVSDGFDDHDPDGSVSLTLIPTAAPSATQENAASGNSSPDEPTAIAQDAPTSISALFAALSACASLYPDPVSPSSSAADVDNSGVEAIEGLDDEPAFDYQILDPFEQSNGLPFPMPGSGGWITAENVNEFFDEEGNWQGRGLGPGAGIVRGREDDGEADGQRTAGEDGELGDGEDTKWRRTE